MPNWVLLAGCCFSHQAWGGSPWAPLALFFYTSIPVYEKAKDSHSQVTLLLCPTLLLPTRVGRNKPKRWQLTLGPLWANRLAFLYQ